MGLIILTLLGLKYLPGWVKLVWLFHLSLKAIGSRNYENEASAQTALAALRSQSRLKVELVARKVGGTPPPLLYDLTALQKDANKRHGFSADKTLSIAQSLYEKKITTYPRKRFQNFISFR